MIRYQRRRVAPRLGCLLPLRGPRIPPFHLLGLTVALCCAAACSDPSPSGAATALVRDSAGIEIVEHPEGAWQDVPIWKISPEPILRVGAFEGEEDYQFTYLADAHRLEGGGVVVLDADQARLSRFDAHGRFVAVAGGQGEGPGEYGRPTALWPIADDSLAVLDPRLRRVSVLDPGLRWVRSVPVETWACCSAFGSLDDGRLLVGDLDPQMENLGYRYSLISPYGPAEELGRFVSILNYPPPAARAPPEELPVFYYERTFVAADSVLYSLLPPDHALAVNDFHGNPRRIVRWSAPGTEPTPEVVDAWIDAQLVATGGSAERRRTYAARYVNEPPAAFQLKTDRSGNAWVGHFRPVWPPHSTEWTVVSPAGRLLGRVSLPEDFTAQDIGEDHVTGRIEDELGVHYLAVYALDRGGREP